MSAEPDADDDAACLALRLEGPLQSWGFEDRFNRRKTGLLPTKSGLAGLCCAALGAARGSEAEAHWLPRLNALRFLIVARPRTVNGRPLEVRRMEDYHTVLNTRTAEGKIRDTAVLTQRTYLNDAAFAVILRGDADTLAALACALADPVWGIWLGRKACIPSAPVLVGVFSSEELARRAVLGDMPLDAFTRQEEADDFADGSDAVTDLALKFADPRRFAPRRVRLLRPGEKEK